MARALVLRGLAAGVLAGLVTFVFAWFRAEPLIQAAIDYEGTRDAAQQALNAAAGLPVEPPGADLVSRAVQGGPGIAVGLVLLGVAMGALVAVAFTLAWGRLDRARPRLLALLVAGSGFLTLFLVPFLKYPTNPPAVGREDTIGDRTGLHLVLVVGAALALVAAVWLARALVHRLGSWNAVLLGLLGFTVLVGGLMALLPAPGELAVNVAQYGPLPTETPQPLRDPAGAIVFPGFDADLLYEFRLYSLASAALLWTTLGLAFGALAERFLVRAGEVASPSRERSSV
ncbi:MAG: CbtA family protein [Pseudonocardia sp.]